MGIFDFLGDLSSKRGKELDLGGLKSLLGTRKAAEAGARGDEMMKITGSDSLPGYFNPETREYVPWYVDLFDGGGLNQSEGLMGKASQEIPSAAGLLETNGAPVQRAEQMAPGIGSQLSDMERLNRMPSVDPRNLGGSEGYGPMGIPGYTLPQSDDLYSARVQGANRAAANAMSNQRDSRLKPASTGYAPGAMTVDFLDKKIDLGAAGYGPPSNTNYDSRNMGGASGYGKTGVAQQMQPAPQGDLNSNPEYQRFIQGLIDMGGFEREMQNPEWLERMFRSATGKDRL